METIAKLNKQDTVAFLDLGLNILQILLIFMHIFSFLIFTHNTECKSLVHISPTHQSLGSNWELC